jgi:hypothetical protein
MVKPSLPDSLPGGVKLLGRNFLLRSNRAVSRTARYLVKTKSNIDAKNGNLNQTHK